MLKKNSRLSNINIKKLLSFSLAFVFFAQILFMSTLSVSASNSDGDIYLGKNSTWEGYDSIEELVAKGVEVNQNIVGEGTVLLKNANNALPLTNEEVAFLGRNTRYMTTNGGGAAAPKSINSTISNKNLVLVDEYAKIGGNINEAAKEYYDSNAIEKPTESNVKSAMMDYSREMDINDLPDSVVSSFSASGDVAVLTFSRFGNEMKDLNRVEKKSIGTSSHNAIGYFLTGGALNDGDHYLMLSPAELNLINFANKHFDKVILLINSPNPLELGFLDDEAGYKEARGLDADKYDLSVDAALWVGLPGYTGVTSVAKILHGDINPSGRMVDILPRDFKADPVWQNQGLSTSSGGDVSGKIGYVHYEEDIYYGYRYWETRGYEEEKVGNSSWYADNVVYPFGYGLSYTSFNYELVSTSLEAGSNFTRETELTFRVKVTNTGNVAGKEVVQVYYSAPYDVHSAPIEKSYVNLVTFGKTKLLQPGESEILELSFIADDMKSYDWQDINNNGIKGYELEAGEYSIKIAKNSHDYPIEVKYYLTESIHCLKDLITGTEVVNRFDEISISEYGCATYMSRADFEGTFPIPNDTKDQGGSEIQYLLTEEDDMAYPFYVSPENMPYYATEPGDNITNKIKLYHMEGRDYNDPLWDQLLDQLTIQEMANIVGEGSYRANALESIAKPYTYEADGPTGWVSEEASTLVCFASTCVLAATFNVEIAEEYGIHLAKEGNTLRDGKSNNQVNFTGLYAPGVNLHRTQFCGRNFEYFSEDAVLTGYMAAAQVKAMTERGILAYVKHFVLNEQETNRYLINTWVSEQNMRENACKAFEIVVKNGNPLAMMNAYNNVGSYQSGMLYHLNITVLRDEWGYKGSLISDWGSHTKMVGGVNAIIRGGVDHIMNNNNGKLHAPTVSEAELTATLVTAIRRGAKNVLYKVANSASMKYVNYEGALNGYYSGGELYAVAGKNSTINIAYAMGYNGLPAEFSYAVAAGSSLPEGLNLNENGIITGTPTTTGNYTFKVVATEKGDIAERSKYSIPEAEFSIQVMDADTAKGIIVPDCSKVQDIASGAYFSMAIHAIVNSDSEASENNIKYEIVENSLPKGLTLEGNVISGVPEERMTSSVKIALSADGYETQIIELNLNIKVVEMSFEVTEIEDLTVGESVHIDIATAKPVVETDTLTGIQYTVKAGSKLPKGLTLTPNGIITGTPEKGYDNYSFVIIADALEADPVEVTFNVTVRGIVAENIEATIYLDKNAFIDINDYVYCNNTENPDTDFFYELVEGSQLMDGFQLFANGTIIGKTSVMKDNTVTIRVSSFNNVPVEIHVTFVVEELYYESDKVEFGDDEDVVEPLEKPYEEDAPDEEPAPDEKPVVESNVNIVQRIGRWLIDLNGGGFIGIFILGGIGILAIIVAIIKKRII